MFVISRNSAFTYKGKAVKLPEVSRELGVQYVAGAYAGLGSTYLLDWFYQWNKDRAQTLSKESGLSPSIPTMLTAIGVWGKFCTMPGGRKYEEAIIPLKKALTLNPNFVPAHINLATCYAELGRLEEARAEMAEILRLNPCFSLEVAKQNSPYKDPADLERYLAALRKAGLK